MGMKPKPKPKPAQKDTEPKESVVATADLRGPLLHQISNLQFYTLDNGGNLQVASSPIPKDTPIFIAGNISPSGLMVAAKTQLGMGAMSADKPQAGNPPSGKDFIIPLGPFANATGTPLQLKVRVRIVSPPGDPAAATLTDNVSS